MLRSKTDRASVKKPLKATKDAWEKLDIVAKLLSSVVIAVIGLAITWSIQRTQIETNEAIAKAQLFAAKLKAEDERRLQQRARTVPKSR